MTGPDGPCLNSTWWMPAFNALMNVFQAILLALVAQRAVRKNREERNGNGQKVQ